MYVRRIKQKRKSGGSRQYLQLVEAFRREDGVPTNRIIAHLGQGDDLLFENLQAAFAASKAGERVRRSSEAQEGGVKVDVVVNKSLQFLPPLVVVHFFRQFCLDKLIDELCPRGTRKTIDSSKVVEALIAHRCIAPDSKLAFQRWLKFVATNEVLGCNAQQLNNSRVHRCLEALAEVDEKLQQRLANMVTDNQGVPRVLYLDLTDTWFEAGGGQLARRGKTKQGHSSKRKIHIALMVNESGLPLRWELLPGALNETVVLPSWLEHVEQQQRYRQAIIVFDRGLPSIDNFHRLVDPESGHLFLTAVKSDAIPTYVELDNQLLDALQCLDEQSTLADIEKACRPLGLDRGFIKSAFRRDLGVVTPPKSNSPRNRRSPPMRGYLYFNPDIQQTKRINRLERLQAIDDFVSSLNDGLARAKHPRKPDPIRAKVTERLRKLKLLEAHEIELIPIEVQGKTKPISSFRVELHRKKDVINRMARYDGLALLLGHPNLELSCDDAIAVYRNKNVVEADFRTIKSVLNIRPTFHWTDSKILAHVTICILALLVERLIEQRLPPEIQSAKAALQELASVELHRIRINNTVHTCRNECPNELAPLIRDLGVKQVLNTVPVHAKTVCSN